VIHICSKCGALLLDGNESCSFCDVSLAEDQEVPQFIAAGRASREAEASAAEPAPEWRTEVSRRLEQYRTRRGRVLPDIQPDTQSGLPFRHVRDRYAAQPQVAAQAASEVAQQPAAPRERRTDRPSARQRQTERVEICIQPELDFSAAAHERSRPQTALVPVASLSERLWAGAVDGLFLGITCAGFAGLFRSLGGQITFDKMDVLVAGAIIYLFYALYICLFTTLAGATPGMQLRGLSIVRLDGTLPDTHQLLWRSFGYLLCGATLTLGFFWALWDEDRFTWQDRISQTYVTAVEPLSDSHSFDMSVGDLPPARRTFAHK
jgi:uncharacterized RDD family membrane protein YckC